MKILLFLTTVSLHLVYADIIYAPRYPTLTTNNYASSTLYRTTSTSLPTPLSQIQPATTASSLYINAQQPVTQVSTPTLLSQPLSVQKPLTLQQPIALQQPANLQQPATVQQPPTSSSPITIDSSSDNLTVVRINDSPTATTQAKTNLDYTPSASASISDASSSQIAYTSSTPSPISADVTSLAGDSTPYPSLTPTYKTSTSIPTQPLPASFTPQSSPNAIANPLPYQPISNPLTSPSYPPSAITFTSKPNPVNYQATTSNSGSTPSLPTSTQSPTSQYSNPIPSIPPQNNNNNLSGTNNLISGSSNSGSGSYNFIVGSSNSVDGNQNTILGNINIINGCQNQVSGSNNLIVGQNNCVTSSSYPTC